jgi:ubiquinone/menaquinone biosynthesis C-methylase UbiE
MSADTPTKCHAFDEEKALGAYVAGHHSSSTASHKRRTAAKDAAHLLPHLKPGMTLLDVGCGPGTITCSFAPYISPGGRIVGIDPSASVIREAQEYASEQGVSTNTVSFQQADGGSLPFEDGSFDVVHSHQVLLHVKDPISLLREMARVVRRPGGLVALKEADLGTFVWYSSVPEVMHTLQQEWLNLYITVHRDTGGEPYAGRRLQAWLADAGLDLSTVISDTVYAPSYSSLADRTWLGEMWAHRLLDSGSGTRKRLLETGLADEAKLQTMAEAWRSWIKDPQGFHSWSNREFIMKL